MILQDWFRPNGLIHSKSGEDAGGIFRIDVVDFKKTGARYRGQLRFGWVLTPVEADSVPIVGAEDDPLLALERAERVRAAMVAPIALGPDMSSHDCAGCGALLSAVDICGQCGSPVCDDCVAQKGGCGCADLNDRAPAIGLIARVQAEEKSRPAKNKPLAHIPQTIAEAVEAEELALQEAADALIEAQEAGDR